MAQIMNVKLSRFDASPWGFRLQGGKDFGSPLVIQKVNGGSPAEKAGLQAGDAVIKVNDVELFNLRHKEAQDQIVRAGNNFEITVQRGGSTWKPQVTPVGPSPVIGSPNIQPVTKTSLAAKPQATPHIGSGHNFAPKPFGAPQVNGDATVKSIVNKQYNSPVGIYSEETIAETLSAQAEVLAGGVLGVNFKKNEKTYNPATSEVLKMVQEIDSEPKLPEPDLSSTSFYATQSHAVGGRATSPRPLTPIARQLQSPTVPRSQTPTNVPTDTPKCSDCERYVIGVFVRIKDKNLHVECFKCATCGTSLKNVGYYNINSKLYCDVHAKLVARQNPPAPNWDPLTIPPGGKAPTGALPASLAKAASTAAAKTTAPTYASAPASASAPARPTPVPAPSSPQSNLAPLPFHQSTSSTAGPKPFSTPTVPITSPVRPTPAGSKFVWPPRAEEEETTPTATPLYIPPVPLSPRPSTPKVAAVAVNSSPKCTPPVSISPKAVSSTSLLPQSILRVDPPVSQPPQSSVPSKVAPFPQPFLEYIEKQSKMSSVRSVASPTPLQQPPLFEELKLVHTTQATQKQETAVSKRLSVCSEEVLSINAEKPAPKFETLTECLTPEGVQRPASPVPMQETSNGSSSVNIPSVTSEAENYKQEGTEVKTEIDSATEIIEQLSTAEEHVSEKDSKIESKDTEQLDQSISTIEISEESIKESITKDVYFIEQKQEEFVSPQSEKKTVQVSEVHTSSQISLKQEVTSELLPTQCSTQSISSFVPVSKEQQLSASQFQQHTRQISSERNILLTSTSTSLSASHLSRDQECPSPMVSARITAADRPYSPLPSVTKPAQCLPAVTSALPQASMSVVSRPEPYASPMISALTIAPDRPYSPLPSATLVSGPSANKVAPSFIQPPTQPLKVQPIQPMPVGPVHISTPSKFVPTEHTLTMLSALTTAPDRPYSPLPTVTRFPGPLPTLSKPATVMAPVTVPINTVSREEACPSPMVAALTIAPERPYSPLIPCVETLWTHQKQLQTSFLPVQPMVTKQIGTQLPVSKTLPLTTSLKHSSVPPVMQPSSVVAHAVQQLPVIGGFRPIVAPNTFRPISQEMPEHSLPPGPQTPKVGIAAPTADDRSGTPRISTLTGLNKPAAIPHYQLEMGEYPGQGPRSATPTCPMIESHARTSQQTATPASYPFPNIPIPEDAKPGANPPSQTFRPIPQPSVYGPVHKPSATPVLATQLPTSIDKTPSSVPNAGGGGSIGGGSSGDKKGIAGSTAPRRGRGVLTQPQGGGRIPVCASCSSQIRGPFITALGKTWCPEHFICVNAQCHHPLADIGFVEEKGELYCEYCFEKYLAPTCDKCSKKVKGDCLNAIGKHFHPECFLCAYCGKLFGNNPFFLEDGLPYCEADWNELFTTKCFACGFPIEAGDRWVEALSNNYHSQCFNCTACKKNLEGQSFYAKGGRPFCKAHAR